MDNGTVGNLGVYTATATIGNAGFAAANVPFVDGANKFTGTNCFTYRPFSDITCYGARQVIVGAGHIGRMGKRKGK